MTLMRLGHYSPLSANLRIMFATAFQNSQGLLETLAFTAMIELFAQPTKRANGGPLHSLGQIVSINGDVSVNAARMSPGAKLRSGPVLASTKCFRVSDQTLWD